MSTPLNRTGAPAQAAGIVEIRFKRDATSEHAASSGHEKQEESQHQTGEDHGEAYAQLRPFELFLTGQKFP